MSAQQQQMEHEAFEQQTLEALARLWAGVGTLADLDIMCYHNGLKRLDVIITAKLPPNHTGD